MRFLSRLSNETNDYSGQSKQSEFTRLAAILRHVTMLDIVVVKISFCAIKITVTVYIWRRIVDESKQIVRQQENELVQLAKQAKQVHTTYAISLVCIRVDVVMSQSSLCLIKRLLRSIIREAFVGR